MTPSCDWQVTKNLHCCMDDRSPSILFQVFTQADKIFSLHGLLFCLYLILVTVVAVGDAQMRQFVPDFHMRSVKTQNQPLQFISGLGKEKKSHSASTLPSILHTGVETAISPVWMHPVSRSILTSVCAWNQVCCMF